MKEDTILCPNCGHAFELSEALTGQIEEHLRKEMLGEIRDRKAELHKKQKALASESERVDEVVEKKLQAQLKAVQEEAVKKAQGDLEVQMKDLQEAVEEKEAKYGVFL